MRIEYSRASPQRPPRDKLLWPLCRGGRYVEVVVVRFQKRVNVWAGWWPGQNTLPTTATSL